MSVVQRFGLAVIVGVALMEVASASEVSVRLVGQAGPTGDPAFLITIDGTPVGSGSVAPPPGVSIYDLADVSAAAETISFPIPDGLLKPDSVVGVAMTNDGYDEATGADTNLYVAGVSVDGVAADVAAASIVTDTGEQKPLRYAAGGALLVAWTATARFTPPEGGWTTALAGTPAASEVPTATEVAVAPTPVCTTKATTAIVDFANGETSVTPAGEKALDAFVKNMATAGCKLEVVGYASPSGEPQINVAVSEGRAKAVLDYIDGKQMGFASQSSSGFGETEQFGASAENRRVVVTVSP